MQTLKLFAGSFLTALFVFPALCPAQTISIVSGNGQLLCPNCPNSPTSFAPLVVQVNDASGAPAPNVTVTWTPTQQGLPTVTATSLTNSAGQATYTFTGLAFFFSLNSYLPATVVAQIPTGTVTSVTFVETTALPNNGGGPAVYAVLSSSTGAAPNLSGAVGTTSATTITVSVIPYIGLPVPGVSVALQAGKTGPSVSCSTAGQTAGAQPGIVLTNVNGSATCTPVFGGTVGTGSYTIIVGGSFASFAPATLTVTPGAPAALKYIGGNKQSVNPGVKATLPLVAEVTDIGGNPYNDAPVTWSVTTGTATLSNASSASASNGYVSAYVTPTVGPVTVVVSLTNNKSVQFAFTVNVNTVVTALQYVSGNDQTAKQGADFTDPLTVTANDNGVPVVGATVNFAITSSGASSGTATLSAASATTNANGQASVSVTAGTTPGPVVVTASVASAECTGGTCTSAFDLTVIPPGPVITSVVNSASYASAPTAASPCSLVTISGTGLATGLQGVVAAFIAPQPQVFGVSVQFGGVTAPILYVANVNGQQTVSAQVPCQTAVVANSTVSMVVTADGAASAPFPVTVTSYSPGIFEFTDTDGATRAVLVRQDGSFVNLANPARPGDTLRMFVTGLGQTNPPLTTNEFDPLVADASGNLVPQVLPVSASLLVGVNGSGVLVNSAKYAYGMVGVYEVEFEVPSNTPLGNNGTIDIVVTQDPAQLFWGNVPLIPIAQ